MVGFSVAAEQSVPDASQIETRLERVTKLTEVSSAARQVRESNSPEAQALHEQAISFRRKAREVYGAGDYAAAKDLLDLATRTMFKAVRLAKPDEVLKEKHLRDYESRLSSVNALLEAHERVSKEKGKEAEAETLRELVHGRIAHAKELADQGKFVEGRKALDEAYVAVKIGIESMRGGDTLVRTLSFATKEEEYHYELDRNDSFRMLVDVMVAEKAQSKPGMEKMIKAFMDRAAKSRETAEEQARAGDFETAVKSLEESSKHIGRAIRSAGVFIPGF
jgi:hypothetical protein